MMHLVKQLVTNDRNIKWERFFLLGKSILDFNRIEKVWNAVYNLKF